MIEQSLEDYYRSVKEEVGNNLQDYDPVKRRCEIKSFTSTSNGRGRGKRKPRRVTLLVVDEGTAYQFENGEIKPRVDNVHDGPHRLAEKVLTDIPKSDRSPDVLLERLMK